MGADVDVGFIYKIYTITYFTNKALALYKTVRFKFFFFLLQGGLNSDFCFNKVKIG